MQMISGLCDGLINFQLDSLEPFNISITLQNMLSASNCIWILDKGIVFHSIITRYTHKH
jgi:hypothetical protein